MNGLLDDLSEPIFLPQPEIHGCILVIGSSDIRYNYVVRELPLLSMEGYFLGDSLFVLNDGKI